MGTPSVLACSRSTVVGLYGSTIEKAMKGAYIAVEAEGETAQLILVSTGSEVGFCVEALKLLVAAGISTQLVSMPCQDVFLEQSQDYQAAILPGNIPTLSVEAAAIVVGIVFHMSKLGWTI